MGDNLSDETLLNLLTACPRAGSLWRHANGGLYEVVGSAINEATQKAAVIYRRQGGGVTFCRSVAEWYQSVPHPEGGLIQRFDLVEFATDRKG